MRRTRALMPESRLPATRIEESLRVIHGFEKVKNVVELIRLVRPGKLSSPHCPYPPVCGFDARIIQDVPNLSLSCPNRVAKNVSSMGMKNLPAVGSSAQMRSASARLSTVSDRYTLRIG